MSNVRQIKGWYVHVLGLVTLRGGIYFPIVLIRKRCGRNRQLRAQWKRPKASAGIDSRGYYHAQEDKTI